MGIADDARKLALVKTSIVATFGENTIGEFDWGFSRRLRSVSATVLKQVTSPY